MNKEKRFVRELASYVLSLHKDDEKVCEDVEACLRMVRAGFVTDLEAARLILVFEIDAKERA